MKASSAAMVACMLRSACREPEYDIPGRSGYLPGKTCQGGSFLQKMLCMHLES